MSSESQFLNLIYIAYMRNYSYDTALYISLLTDMFHAEICSYFNANRFWNSVTDFLNSVLLMSQEYESVSEKLEQISSESNVEWEFKISENVKAHKIELSAGIFLLISANMKVKLAVCYNFSASKSEKVILLITFSVKHKWFYYKSSFKA